MTAYRAARAGGRVFGALALVASLGLAGCSDIDEAMFGTDEADAQNTAAPGTLPAQQEAQAQPERCQTRPRPPRRSNPLPPPRPAHSPCRRARR